MEILKQCYDSANGANGYYTAKGLIIGNAYDAGKTTTDDRNVTTGKKEV